MRILSLIKSYKIQRELRKVNKDSWFFFAIASALEEEKGPWRGRGLVMKWEFDLLQEAKKFSRESGLDSGAALEALILQKEKDLRIIQLDRPAASYKAPGLKIRAAELNEVIDKVVEGKEPFIRKDLNRAKAIELIVLKYEQNIETAKSLQELINTF